MKKIIALLLVFSLIIPGMIMPSFAVEVTNEHYGEDIINELEILKHLNIAEQDTDLSKKVTRKEFAEYIGKMLNLGTQGRTNRVYFTDVPSGSIINDLVELGIFNGTVAETFSPNDEIVLSHACVALVRALGYVYNDSDSENIYQTIVRRLDIDEDVVYDDGATNRNILIMIYNTLMTAVAEPSYERDKSGVWSHNVKWRKDGQSLIENVFDAYVIDDGIVTETYISSLSGAGTISKDEIKIDKKTYKCQIPEAAELIGQHINALVSTKENIEEVIYISADETENDTIAIDADDIGSFDDYCLTYYDENDKEREVKFETTMSLIYNGVAESKNIKKFFELKEGTVKCVKGRDNLYSVAIITEFVNVRVAKAANLHDLIIYTESVPPYNALCFDDASDTFKKVYLASNGTEVGATVLVARDILSVIRSTNGKYIKAYICTETVKGKLESISNAVNKIYTINGKEYEAAPGFDPLDKYKLGDNVEYILDATGRLAAVSNANTTGDKTVGYLYQMSKNDYAFDDVKLKIYTQNKEHKIFECADKVQIDGVSVNKEDIRRVLGNGSGELKRTVVFFETNSEGKLVYIDTPAASKDDRESSNSLWIYEKEGNFKFDDTNKMFYPKYPLWYDTFIFCIPSEDDLYPEELSFDVYMDKTGPFVSKANYRVSMYKFSDDTPFVDVITYDCGDRYTGEILSLDKVMLVEGIKQVIDEDGVGVYVICGAENGTYKEYRVENGVDISNIGEGDIIRTGRNGRGYVSIKPELVYDYSEDKKSWPGFASASYDSNGRFTLGYIEDIYHYNVGGTNNGRMSAVSVSTVPGGEIEEMYLLDTNSNNFMIYDSLKRDYKVYVGSINEAVSNDLNTGEPSKIFIHVNGTNVVNVIIYR